MPTEYPPAPQTPEYRRAISELAANLAHEVRNPLSLAKANLDVLELEAGAGEGQRYRAIRRELERINDIMGEFIAVSRREPSRKAAFNLTEAARELTGDFAQVYRDVAFAVDAAGDVMAVGDRKQICRVLMNLLKNAVESIRAEGAAGRVTVRVAAAEGRAAVAVEDNGGGLGQAEARKLAMPFYTTKQGGTGLGLYVCKQIAAEHGGGLTLTQGAEGGAVAELTLPAEG